MGCVCGMRVRCGWVSVWVVVMMDEWGGGGCESDVVLLLDVECVMECRG